VWFETLTVLASSTFFCFPFIIPMLTFHFSYYCSFVSVAIDHLYWSCPTCNRGLKSFTL
jgi:hypothetical protein